MESVVTRPSFWSGKRVFVTGHTGFKGGWMSLWLARMGAHVTGYALAPSTEPSLFETARVHGVVESLIDDIRNFAALRAAVAAARPEIVFHLAAQPLVRRSYAEPRETFDTNVMGTVNLLEAVRAVGGVHSVVVVTTDKCYENREWHWGYREGEPLGGRDPYSSSKACAELVTAAYRQSFFANGPAIASARAGNVLGGGDWSEDRLIPDFLRAMEQGRGLDVRHPDATRPWQHVLDPLAGYLLLAERLCEDGERYASAWNFGPSDDEARSVEWIADEFARYWGKGATWRRKVEKGVHEATYLKLDSSRARELLGWRPRITLEAGLQSLVAWHKAHRSGGDMQAATLRQIDAYANGSGMLT